MVAALVQFLEGGHIRLSGRMRTRTHTEAIQTFSMERCPACRSWRVDNGLRLTFYDESELH